ncbi:unnamed protein product [Owenia fusiformis]|uniref:Protein SON n=1 Tax=Owenia fusiformis TaxID=6347 RepID=A0A8S4Q131_OWEFU|nr:unnamed protein product [Owenia fusiformis]
MDKHKLKRHSSENLDDIPMPKTTDARVKIMRHKKDTTDKNSDKNDTNPKEVKEERSVTSSGHKDDTKGKDVEMKVVDDLFQEFLSKKLEDIEKNPTIKIESETKSSNLKETDKVKVSKHKNPPSSKVRDNGHSSSSKEPDVKKEITKDGHKSSKDKHSESETKRKDSKEKSKKHKKHKSKDKSRKKHKKDKKHKHKKSHKSDKKTVAPPVKVPSVMALESDSSDSSSSSEGNAQDDSFYKSYNEQLGKTNLDIPTIDIKKTVTLNRENITIKVKNDPSDEPQKRTIEKGGDTKEIKSLESDKEKEQRYRNSILSRLGRKKDNDSEAVLTCKLPPPDSTPKLSIHSRLGKKPDSVKEKSHRIGDIPKLKSDTKERPKTPPCSKSTKKQHSDDDDTTKSLPEAKPSILSRLGKKPDVETNKASPFAVPKIPVERVKKDSLSKIDEKPPSKEQSVVNNRERKVGDKKTSVIHVVGVKSKVPSLPTMVPHPSEASAPTNGKQTSAEVSASVDAFLNSLGSELTKTSTGNVFETPQAPAATVKKPSTGFKIGLKLSDTTAELISSGTIVENDPKKQSLEEGELTPDTEDESSSSSDSESGSVSHDNGFYGDGEIDSDGEPVDKRKKRKKHRKKKDRKEKKDKKERSRERSRSKRKTSRDRSRSPKRSKRSSSKERRSYDKDSGVWRDSDRTRRHSRERDYDSSRKRRSRSRERFRDRDRDHFRDRRDDYRRSRSRERYRRRSRSRSRERSRARADSLRIDKKRLREIAIAKAYANMKAGVGPAVNLRPEEVAAIRSGGKSVNELTDFCKKISEKQGHYHSSGEDSDLNRPVNSDEDELFINHPFKMRDAPITMNIRDSRALPVMNSVEKSKLTGQLRIEFPVSSGNQHRVKESEISSSQQAYGDWMPVEKKKDEEKPKVKPEDKVFPDATPLPANVDIGSVVSERLKAVRKLQDNPNDVQAINEMYKVNKKMSQWAESKNQPGAFTGSTGAKVLSQSELMGPDKKRQAWIKKDVFTNAAPLGAGIGKLLLQRMGWHEGQGLGKDNEGSKEPLMLDFKIDRKGLQSMGEKAKGAGVGVRVIQKDLSGKHPVSALMEITKKRHWPAPLFQDVHESGPAHKKNFLCKVTVNGTEYQPSVASNNKKHAKAQAATVCLQHLGMVPMNPLQPL